MRYGKFQDREYVIVRPDTPTPWINYISNPQGYCGIVSQSGGGFSFYKDPRDRRITKYRYNNVPVDRPGRYFYIKDKETGEYFSPTWQPVRRKPEHYECRHGQGYTRIQSTCNGLDCSVLYLVPRKDSCEIWHLTLKNQGTQPRDLGVYSYSEFTLWSEPQSRNIQWSLHLTRAHFNQEMIYYHFIEPHPHFDRALNARYKADRPGFAFMGMSEKVLDFETVRDSFIGMYHSESDPLGLEKETLTNSQLSGGVGCAALRAELRLEPGEQKDLTVILGFAEKEEEAVELRERYRTPAQVNRALEEVREEWTRYLVNLSWEGPDEEMETFLNIWNPYQCKTTFDWSRYISFYENGEGRGMGTRDSCQDTLGVALHLPRRVRARILEIVSTCQFESGACYHQFFPLGQEGDLEGFSDDHLWLVQMVYAYIAETGDLAILKEELPYAGSEKKASLFQHLLDALNYTARMTGPHGLPLILNADWNDTLHLWMEAERPESVMTAALYVYALKLTAGLAEKSGRQEEGRKLRNQADLTARLVNEHCWDGKWYIRGFGSKVIGTAENQEARIFLNSQTWCLIAGIADEKRARVCMDSVKEYLASEEGVKLIWPVFRNYDQSHGLISRYVPGHKENGIFAHANAWAIVAETLLGRGDQAFIYYRNIMPLKWNDRAEEFKTEPYVFCQTICSEDGQNRGEGSNSWLTGTASWMYLAATQHILGLKPELDGLSVNPCVPGSWDRFSVTRMFRGCCLRIQFRRTGRFSIKVEGQEIPGNLIPPLSRKEARVEVEY